NPVALGRRVLIRYQYRAPLVVYSARPGYVVDQFRAAQKLARGSIENIEESVAIGMQYHLAHLAAELHVDQDGPALGVPIVRVVRRELEVPLPLPCIEIQGDERTGVEVVALSGDTDEVGPRVACGPVERVQLRVEG